MEKNNEIISQIILKYGNVNPKTINDEELDRQIVEIGRLCCHDNRPVLNHLLEIRKNERWNRKLKELPEWLNANKDNLQQRVENLCDELKKTVTTVYYDTLGMAQSRAKEKKEDNDYEFEKYEAQVYVEDFDEKANKYADVDNELPGLLDIIMPLDMMEEDFCPISYLLGWGDHITCPEFDELFMPRGLETKWKRLAKQYLADTPLMNLSCPLRRLCTNYKVPLQDILSIRRFGFSMTDWM